MRGWFKRFTHKKTIPKVGFDEFRHQYKIQHGRVSRKIDENRVGRLISKADSESKRNKRLKQPDRKEKSVERACFHQNSVTPRRAPRQRRTHRRPDDRQGAPGRRRPTLRRRPGAAPPGAGYAPPVAGGAIALPSRLTDCASFSFLFFFFPFYVSSLSLTGVFTFVWVTGLATVCVLFTITFWRAWNNKEFNRLHLVTDSFQVDQLFVDLSFLWEREHSTPHSLLCREFDVLESFR